MSPPATSDAYPAHLSCPFCGAYAIERMYLGSLHLDSCGCGSCGARWDQHQEHASFRARAEHTRR